MDFNSAAPQGQTLLVIEEQMLQRIVTNVVNQVIAPLLPPQRVKLTREQACERVQISLATLHSWINKGILKAEKIGGRTLIDERDLEEAIQSKTIFRYQHGRR